MTKEVLEKANEIDRQLELIHEYIQSGKFSYCLKPGEFKSYCDKLGITRQVLEILVTIEHELQKEFDEL